MESLGARRKLSSGSNRHRSSEFSSGVVGVDASRTESITKGEEEAWVETSDDW